MRLRLPLLLALILPMAACRTAAPGGVATRPAATPDPAPPADASAGEVRPGHYALSARWHQYSSCSQSWDDYTARASLVLDLGEDGGATACRGREVSDVNPDGHFATREQQGFRGTWRRDGAWIEVQFVLADDVCAPVRANPARAPDAWHLRCMMAQPAPGTTALPGPLLACRFATPAYSEELGYVAWVLDSQYVLLGAGPGVRVGSDHDGWQDEVRVEYAATPVTFDEWTRPF